MSDTDDMKAAIKQAANNQWRNDNLEAKRAYERAYYAHQTGGFRGWLCRECNLMLGNARDDPQRLRDGAAYLEGTLTNKTPR